MDRRRQTRGSAQRIAPEKQTGNRRRADCVVEEIRFGRSSRCRDRRRHRANHGAQTGDQQSGRSRLAHGHQTIPSRACSRLGTCEQAGNSSTGSRKRTRSFGFRSPARRAAIHSGICARDRARCIASEACDSAAASSVRARADCAGDSRAHGSATSNACDSRAAGARRSGALHSRSRPGAGQPAAGASGSDTGTQMRKTKFSF